MTETKTQAAADGPAHAPVRLPRTPYRQTLDRPAESDAAAGARWDADRLHDRVAAAVRGRPPFVLHDGPPYANGDVHMGHALNKVLKDMVLRLERGLGRDATLVPGWDCHGLPVEWKVEETFRARGVDKAGVPVLEFRKACRDYATHWVERQKAGFRRLGVLARWDAPYLTMSAEADAATVREVHRLLEGGLLYRALRPVLWSVPEQTALADAEVEYRPERYTSLLVRFPVRDGWGKGRTSLVCWTTTPWSLPGNRAVACAPDALYGVYEVSEGTGLLRAGERLVLVRDRAEDVLARAGATAWTEHRSLTGAELAGTVCAHPLAALGYGHDVPVLPADFVSTEDGTGLVHVAPGLGPEDYRLGLAHALPVLETVGPDGRYVATVPTFAGAVVVGSDGRRGDADGRVLEALAAAGMTVASWTDRHDTAHSWRSKAPLVYRATPQWFVRVDGTVPGGRSLRETALAALDDVAFLPPEGRTRLASMLAGRPDWCVSRQRSWGVPLGLFVHRRTGEVLQDPAVLARVQAAFAEESSDAWYARPKSWFLGPAHDPDDWEQVMDVLDVWFESGSTHAWVLDGGVADLYLEGSDQHRGWFQASLLEAVGTRGRPPFRAVLTHGFVLDAKGRKMSKSEGNVVDPLQLADQHGADVLRLWVAMSDVEDDVRVSPAALALARDTLKKLRNTLRFALGNLAGEGRTTLPPLGTLAEPERWMLGRLNAVGRDLREKAKRYDFAGMTRALHAFASDDLSAFWFDLRKDSLYCDPVDACRRRGTVAVLDRVFDHLALWMSVMAPFSADEAWRERHPDGPSVHETPWPEPDPDWDDTPLERRWALVREARSLVMSALDEAKLKQLLKANADAEAVVSTPAADRLAGLDPEDFALALGVSAARVEAADGTPCATVHPMAGGKCPRCRRMFAALSDDGLCRRCDAF